MPGSGSTRAISTPGIAREQRLRDFGGRSDVSPGGLGEAAATRRLRHLHERGRLRSAS